MKQALGTILVPIEISIVQDIINIIGQAVHTRFSHNDIHALQQALISKAQAALQENQSKAQEEVQNAA